MPESNVNAPLSSHLKREIAVLFGSKKTLTLLALVAFLAGLSGPFGTYEALSPFQRHLYWVLAVIGTAATGHVAGTAVEHVLRGKAWPTIPRLLAASVLTSLPVFGVMTLVMLGFGFQPDSEDLLVLLAQCLVVVGGVTFLQFFTFAPAIEPKQVSIPMLICRLPHNKRGRLIRLMAQDHYVEVVTDTGRALVSMRFRDAIAETVPEAGVQVHRSHWVALHAVTGRSRKNDRTGLRLCDESVVPVGRKFKNIVRQKGLF